MIKVSPLTLNYCLPLLFMLSGVQASESAPFSDIPPGLGISTDGSTGIIETPAVRPETGNLTPAANHHPEATTVERIVWDKTPIAISLSIGSERMITFPGPVRVGIPGSLGAQLRTLSQDGTVYWLARAAFAATRIQIQDVTSGHFYLVDLSATANHYPAGRIEIINATVPESVRVSTPPEGAQGNTDASAAAHPQRQSGYRQQSRVADYTLLTRFCAQQLYAPARLLKTPPGIHAAPLTGGHLAADTLIRGGGIVAEPVAAWRKGTLHVTAVKLTNTLRHAVTLDPRLIRGQWRTATFQHAYLGSSEGDDKVTALYLVSDRPFAEVY